MRPIILVAAGGLAREVAEVVRILPDRKLLGAVDDDQSRWGTTIDGLLVLGGLGLALERTDADVVLCAGQGKAREVMAARLKAGGLSAERYASVIDPSVRIPTSCRVGAGSVILAGTVLTASVRIGRHVVCMPQVTLTHDNDIDDFATLCAGVTLGGGVGVGRAAYLGMSASVREGRTVGDRAMLGMGSVLLEDLPTEQTWVGLPARRLHRAEGSPVAQVQLSKAVTS